MQSLELKGTLETIRTQLYHLINEEAQAPEKPSDFSKNIEQEGSAIQGGKYIGLAFRVRKSMFEFSFTY